MTGDPLAALLPRLAIVENPALPIGTVYATGNASAFGVTRGTAALVIGTRPETEVEYSARWVRWYVRHQFGAELLAQLGEEVGAEPQRGDLQTVVARLRAQVAAA